MDVFPGPSGSELHENKFTLSEDTPPNHRNWEGIFITKGDPFVVGLCVISPVRLEASRGQRLGPAELGSPQYHAQRN